MLVAESLPEWNGHERHYRSRDRQLPHAPAEQQSRRRDRCKRALAACPRRLAFARPERRRRVPCCR